MFKKLFKNLKFLSKREFELKSLPLSVKVQLRNSCNTQQSKYTHRYRYVTSKADTRFLFKFENRISTPEFRRQKDGSVPE